MNDVFIKPVGTDAPVGPANALRRCLFRIGRPGNQPAFFYGVTAVINNSDQFLDKMIFAGQIGNDLSKKRFVAKVLIMLPGNGAGSFRDVNADHFQTGVPEFGQNAPDELFADAIGLDNNKGGFTHDLILAIMRSRSSSE